MQCTAGNLGAAFAASTYMRKYPSTAVGKRCLELRRTLLLLSELDGILFSENAIQGFGKLESP
jgi:hypothetical protein